MHRKTCFDPSRSLHDRRFRRKLSGWEFKDFFLLLWFAADECRDPAFVPAHKVPDLAMELGMTGKDGRAKFASRLAKWSAPGIELITLEEGGGLQINYVLDQDVEESQARAYVPPATAPGNGHSPPANLNGNGVSGGNNNGGVIAITRRPRKNQSSSPGAEDKRYAYWQAKADSTGLTYVYDGITFTPAGHEVSENSPENLRASESKPPVLTGELGEKDGELGEKDGEFSPGIVEVSSENSLAGASRVTVVRGSKDSYNSDYSALTVPRDQNLRETSGAKTSVSAETSPASPSSVASDLSGPIRPLPRPEIKPHMQPALCEADVKAVRALVGDGPEWRNQWVALWRHCIKKEVLHCWDEGFAILVWRLRVSPVSGPGVIRKPSVFLRGTIWALLKDADAPYVPASQANGSGKPAAEPVDEVQLAEIRRSIQDVKERWDAEIAEGSFGTTPLGVAGTTPLKEIFVGDIQDDAAGPLEDLYTEGQDE